MPKLDLKNTVIDISVQSDKEISIDNPDIQHLVYLLKLFNSKIPLKHIKLQKTGSKFTYLVEAKDGRLWNQEFYFDDAEPTMTFDVTDKWKITEFSVGREPRSQIIKIIQVYGCTKCDCVWL